MPAHLTETDVKVAARGWFGKLGIVDGHGSQITLGEPAAEHMNHNGTNPYA